MKKQIAIALSAAALLASTASFAKAGPYVQGQLGWGGMDTANKQLNVANPTSQSHKLRKDVAGRVSFGYMFDNGTNPLSFGVETGFAKYSDNKYKATAGGNDLAVTYQRQDFDVLGVAKYDTGSNINVFGKAGLDYAMQKTKISGSFAGVTDYKHSSNVFKPEVAVGVGYDFSQELGMNVSYNHIFGDKANPNNVDQINNVAPVNAIMVGLTYSF